METSSPLAQTSTLASQETVTCARNQKTTWAMGQQIPEKLRSGGVHAPPPWSGARGLRAREPSNGPRRFSLDVWIPGRLLMPSWDVAYMEGIPRSAHEKRVGQVGVLIPRVQRTNFGFPHNVLTWPQKEPFSPTAESFGVTAVR